MGHLTGLIKALERLMDTPPPQITVTGPVKEVKSLHGSLTNEQLDHIQRNLAPTTFNQPDDERKKP